ncbi:MAG: hypothetical protein AAFQ34_03100 [Pseudomonadota bacterium]
MLIQTMARILFIGIDYFDYPTHICAALERLGHTVAYHPIEDRGFASKVAKTLAFCAYEKHRAAYHARLIEESASADYDVVLFIQVHQMRHSALESLRALHPNARFVLYNWDSLSTHDYRPWARHFDWIATFDPDDARALGVAYLPLFAIPRFFEIEPQEPSAHDIYFVGSLVTMQRFDALARLYGFCESAGFSTRFHLMCNPIMKAKLRRAGKSLPGLSGQGLGFDEIVAMLEASRATFDFANHNQSGYTMRLIENMCAGRKIITENPRILGEPFYREDRILLVDGHDFTAVPAFLETPVSSELDENAFHIDAWAKRLIEG